MTDVKVEIRGLDELERKLGTISEHLRKKTALNAVTAGAAKVEEYTKRNIFDTFSEKQTGSLANSVTVTATVTQNGAEASIAPMRVYARIQEFGGTVHAKPGGFLHFKIGDAWVRTKQVTIPARPYLGPAVNDNQEQIISAMREEVELGIAQSV